MVAGCKTLLAALPLAPGVTNQLITIRPPPRSPVSRSTTALSTLVLHVAVV